MRIKNPIENPVDAILRDREKLQAQLYTGNTDEACYAFLLEKINSILDKKLS